MRATFSLPVNLGPPAAGQDQELVTIDLGGGPIEEWCLGLCLLEKGLLESVTVSATSGSFRLEIAKDASVARSERCRVIRTGGGMRLRVSVTELEYWLHYFLKYYRDGVADVDHIDVDVAPDRRRGTVGLFLVLKVAMAKPPVSEREARRRLGL